MAAQVDGATSWWSAGHTGGEGASDTNPGVDVGLAGDVPDPTHPAFAGVTVDNLPGQTPDEHGTHVGGIVASGDATYRGLSYGIDRLIGGATDYELGFGDPAASDPAEVMNESFGGPASSDDDANAVFEDALSSMLGVSWAAGAGNDGDCSALSGGPDRCVASPSIARNLISVGAYSDVHTVSTADDQVATFSSHGPTYAPTGQSDGRKKPDLTAPGVGITSPTINWNQLCSGQDPDNTCFDFTSNNGSGTSMSSPQVAAGAALLEGDGITDPRAVKAILIDSARQFPTQTQSWQPDVGWGALDLSSAFAQKDDFKTGSVAGGSAKLYKVAAAPQGTKATLAWFRRATWGSFPTCCAMALTTTNLDLHGYRVSDESEIDPSPSDESGAGPTHLDDNDTVEQMKTPPSEGTQDVIFKVKAASTVVGASSEPFAIAAGAPITQLSNPEVQPSAVLDHPEATSSPGVPCDTPIKVTTTLTNSSTDFDAENASVEMSTPNDVQLTDGDQSQTVAGGTLAKGATSESHEWTVTPTTPGTSSIRVIGHGDTLDETFDYPQTINITCHDYQPPQIKPVNASYSPSGTQYCGTDITLAAQAQNNSIDADAADASLTLTNPEGNVALPSAVKIISTPDHTQAQQVSGGTLDKGETSEVRTWTLRQKGGGSVGLAIRGFGYDAAHGNEAYTYVKQLPLLRCKLRPSKLRVTSVRRRPGGAIRVRGYLLGPSSGTVRIQGRLGSHKRTRSIRTDSHHRFVGRLNVCFAGSWKVSASYAGNSIYAPARTGSRSVFIPASDLRC